VGVALTVRLRVSPSADDVPIEADEAKVAHHDRRRQRGGRCLPGQCDTARPRHGDDQSNYCHCEQ